MKRKTAYEVLCPLAGGDWKVPVKLPLAVVVDLIDIAMEASELPGIRVALNLDEIVTQIEKQLTT